MKKWISALLISIVAGFAVWFFTQSSYSPFLGPNVELGDPEMPERIVAGEEFQISFRVTNLRNRTERDCHGFVMLRPFEPDEGNEAPGEASATATRAPARCRTRTPKFYLGSLSGSSTEVIVDCLAYGTGDFRMIHGVSCRSGENSKWQMDHQTFIQVHPG